MVIFIGIVGFIVLLVGIVVLIINAIRRGRLLIWGITALCGFGLLILGIGLSEMSGPNTYTPSSEPEPNTPIQNPAPSASPVEEPEPSLNPNTESSGTITAEELWQEVDTNPIVADLKYEGTTLRISGKVSNITDSGWLDDDWDEIGVVGVWLDAGFIESIYCYFDSIDDILPLVQGQEVIIQGTYAKAATAGVDMIHCTVVQY
jgi:hypothetical protein